MPTIADIAQFLESFAPPGLAEEWDNVGLLVGDTARDARRVMTCLTVTGASAGEAIREKADLIVTHHPLPFRGVKRITVESPEGRLLWELIGAKVAVYSPHTAFDSAAEGINQRLAAGLELCDIVPLVPHVGQAFLPAWQAGKPAPPPAATEPMGPPLGAGRWGQLAAEMELGQLAQRVKRFLAIDHLQLVGDAHQKVRRVAVACGSAGEFLAPAAEQGCDCLVTGETRFHTCLEAEARGVALLLAGHYASERFAVECLADVLARQFPDAVVWASREERDPLRWV
jgi:dinuclear metal center YbgI/SA1388 family protein